jgi:hypothetical protein
MTRTGALVAILIGGLCVVAAAVLGMAAVGVSGELLSLGGIVPLAVMSFLVSLVFMHFGAYEKRRR